MNSSAACDLPVVSNTHAMATEASGSLGSRAIARAASVKTGIKKRDEHLCSTDFFDADAHPEISVVVTDVTPTGEGTADLRTELTVRGITRPVPLSATIEHAGDGTVRISTQTTVDRTAFGVSGNMAGMMPTAARSDHRGLPQW